MREGGIIPTATRQQTAALARGHNCWILERFSSHSKLMVQDVWSLPIAFTEHSSAAKFIRHIECSAGKTCILAPVAHVPPMFWKREGAVLYLLSTQPPLWWKMYSYRSIPVQYEPLCHVAKEPPHGALRQPSCVKCLLNNQVLKEKVGWGVQSTSLGVYSTVARHDAEEAKI